MIPGGCGCWTDRVDMGSSLSGAGQTAVDHAILQSTDGIQKGKSQSVYHNHIWLSPWWSSQFCSPSSSTYQWSGKKRGNTQGPHTERVPPRSASYPEEQTWIYAHRSTEQAAPAGQTWESSIQRVELSWGNWAGSESYLLRVTLRMGRLWIRGR